MKIVNDDDDVEKRRPFRILMPLTLKMPTKQHTTTIDGRVNLFTKTWPPPPPSSKRINKTTSVVPPPPRPLTATLDKPTILNINLRHVIDMSLVRKEFLGNITNLCCRIPTITKTINNNSYKKIKAAAVADLVPPPSSGKHRTIISPDIRRRKSISATKPKKYSTKCDNKLNTSSNTTKKQKKSRNSDANNNNICIKGMTAAAAIIVANSNKKRASAGAVVGTVRNNNNKIDLKSTKRMMMEACRTCGRPDQPERFHSHPVAVVAAAAATNKNKINSNISPVNKPPSQKNPPVKSTVQKPVAIKYKSSKTTKQIIDSKNKAIATPHRSPHSPQQQKPLLQTTMPKGKSSSSSYAAASETTATPPRIVRSASKRTVTCYICGREFGTASLPLHEPKCLEKWERENNSLPQHLRRKPPPKPDHQLNQEEWNKFAWEASQSTLLPCPNCGRTFNPDRLVVHQRSCKIVRTTTNDQVKVSDHHNTLSSKWSNMTPPPTIECYICGRPFGTHSIKIHEQQCLKKWRIENETLPMDMRAVEPRREGGRNIGAAVVKDNLVLVDDDQEKMRRKSPPMFPCYICGRLFTVNSIYIHEPQCLKMWKIENDQLPLHKKRPQPLKPDIKFTHEGKIDFAATHDSNWQSHLSQLVPCKFCARTFNPDRVTVHERSCKG